MAKVRLDYREKVRRAFDAMPKQPLGTSGFYTHSLKDLMDVRVPAPRQGDRWGPWVYQARSHTLWHEESDYPIDLYECTTCAELLDTVFHVSQKTWMSREAIGHLIEALHDLLEPMAHLCSCGRDQGPFDVQAWLKSRPTSE